MAKGSKSRKSSNKKTQQKPVPQLSDSDMDDDIDIFHKQRDVVPLDLDDDMDGIDEEDEHLVFPIEDGDDDEEDDEDEDEDEDDSEDDTKLTGLAAKIARQQRSLKAKIGGAEDETHDDAEDEEKRNVAWGRSKNIYYDDNKGEASDDEDLAEEDEVLRLQKEKAKEYSNADHGLEDDTEDESQGDRTFEEILAKGKGPSKPVGGHEPQDETDTGYEVVKKDLNALSREEQMDIVYNSAPELVGLLAELNDAVEQLETKIDPIFSNVKDGKSLNKTGMQYMELKKQLLLSYCQAIAFHLLLKSEGQPVRDHPVIARLVEIKNLLDKVKQLDENLSFSVEDILKENSTKIVVNSPEDIEAVKSDSLANNCKITVVPTETQKEPCKETETMKMDCSMDLENRGKCKRQNEQLGLQSVEMLKVRAALEEKLKQKGVFNLKAPKPDGVKRNRRPLNGKLEALDDFDDDALDIEGTRNNGHANEMPSNRLSQLVTPRTKKPKVISGDDDLPKRDDIGERRRKHEMRVLATAGINSDDDLQDNEHMQEDGDTDLEPDLYKETKLKRAAKLAAKAQKYSRTTPSVTSLPETPIDGKRHINYEMEKNRGLTRKRNKDIKNPRKKYKLKHKKKEVARKGQVREIRKPTGSYGGEFSGINTKISRSVRL